MDLANTLQNDYKQKSEMNQEAEHVFFFLGRKRFQRYLLIGAIKDNIAADQTDEWMGFIQQIKYNSLRQSEKVQAEMNKMDNKISAMKDEMKEKMELIDHNMSEKMELMDQKMSEKIDHVIKLLEK